MEKRTVFKAEGGKRCPKHTAGMSLRLNIIGCGIWRAREVPPLVRIPSPQLDPYGRLSCVVFVAGTIEDCIRGVQNIVDV